MKNEIYKQEFIGKTIKITKSNNKEQENITGKIIDETKNTFKIRLCSEPGVQGAVKTILKNDKTFEINKQKIDGNKITKKPEERIKIKGQ